MKHVVHCLRAALALTLASTPSRAQTSPSSGTTHFVLDGNRIYAELGFVRPNGSVHRALAFVDMGSAAMDVDRSLFAELHIDRDHPLVFLLGRLRVTFPGSEVTGERAKPAKIGASDSVEGVLSAGVLQHYRVSIDYAARTLTLARSGAHPLRGVAVPFRMDLKTGLISVNAMVDAHHYWITIDNGSAFTWIRGDSARAWLDLHPEWVRGVGAVGASNMTMTGDATETAGTIMHVPRLSLGPLVLRDVDALAAGRGPPASGALDLFDWYSTKNAGAVVGWIGGNVLRHYRLTIDYPTRVMYWSRQSEPDVCDLCEVGLTLRSEGGAIFVAAIATKNGRPTVMGVMPGDRLVRIGNLDLATASKGAIYDALHGTPGESRALTLERNGARVSVNVPVTAF